MSIDNRHINVNAVNFISTGHRHDGDDGGISLTINNTIRMYFSSRILTLSV